MITTVIKLKGFSKHHIVRSPCSHIVISCSVSTVVCLGLIIPTIAGESVMDIAVGAPSAMGSGRTVQAHFYYTSYDNNGGKHMSSPTKLSPGIDRKLP